MSVKFSGKSFGFLNGSGGHVFTSRLCSGTGF